MEDFGNSQGFPSSNSAGSFSLFSPFLYLSCRAGDQEIYPERRVLSKVYPPYHSKGSRDGDPNPSNFREPIFLVYPALERSSGCGIAHFRAIKRNLPSSLGAGHQGNGLENPPS